jgi:hypothetical protein
MNMAQPHTPAPCLLVVAAFSRYPEALALARERLEAAYGPTALVSEPFVFDQTDYYAATMGTDLRKQFYTFRHLVAADCLPKIKRHTNILEAELAAHRAYAETRPVNLDPGLLNLGKFMLATTKDQAHRIYIGEGIFAEVTLRFQASAFQPWPWTYADYRVPGVLEFLRQAREVYRGLLGDSLRGNP